MSMDETNCGPSNRSDVTKLSSEMMQKTSDYINGQFEGTLEEYKLLEKMNETVAQRYGDMKSVTKNVEKSLLQLNDKYIGLQPYLEQIDEIDSSSKRLEEVAYALDNYVKKLEQRFKQLEKRGSSPT